MTSVTCSQCAGAVTGVSKTGLSKERPTSRHAGAKESPIVGLIALLGLVKQKQGRHAKIRGRYAK